MDPRHIVLFVYLFLLVFEKDKLGPRIRMGDTTKFVVRLVAATDIRSDHPKYNSIISLTSRVARNEQADVLQCLP